MIIDSNIFLEITLEQNKSNRCEIFLRSIINGEREVFISTFSIDSIVISMIRNNVDLQKIDIFLRSLAEYKGLRFYQIRIIDRINALLLMKKYSLDYDDAIILQTALSTKSKEILSFDKHFDRIKEINRVEP